MKKLGYCGLIVLLLWVLPATAQKGISRQAEKKYAAHNFEKAASLWQKAYSQSKEEPDRHQFAFKTGMAYHRMNKFSESLQWYSAALANYEAPAEWLLAQADAMLKTGQLEGAKAATNKALAVDRFSLEAKQLLLLIENYEASRNIGFPPIYEAQKLNTNSSDYSASWFNNDLILSSSRESYLSKKKDRRTAENYSSLYLSIENLYGDFAPAIPLPIENNQNTGVAAYDPKNQRLYYTRCNNNKGRCLIEVSRFDSVNFVFGKGKPVGFINKKYHYGHPYLSPDGSKLYFSATLPDGYGGNDIYSVALLPDGSWGIPENAGPLVNTAFDELFPSLLGDSILLFSSEGLKNGFGGLDIVAVDIGPSGYGNPRVLLPPFNSSADDFSLLMRADGSKGIFSSNRNKGKSDDLFFFENYPLRNILNGKVCNRNDSIGIDSASIHFEIEGQRYSTASKQNGSFILSLPEKTTAHLTASRRGYYPEKISINSTGITDGQTVIIVLSPMDYEIFAGGVVTDRTSSLPMQGEKVELIGPGGEITTSQTDRDGKYLFKKLQQDRIYTVRISGPGIFTESRVIRVPDIRQNITLQKENGYDLNFELTRITEKEEITLKDIFYDFDKAELREASKTELQKLASMLRETPVVNVQISSHTDGRGTDAYNDRLSQERAQAVVDYLVASDINPLRLIAKGYGKRKMVFPNATNESQHQANRRTTFQVLAFNQATAGNLATEVAANQTEAYSERLVFRVQVLVSANRYDTDSFFSALKAVIPNIRFYVHEQEKLYRYEIGDRYKLSEAESLRNLIRSAGFPDSFIVPYLDGEKISIQQAKDFKP